MCWKMPSGNKKLSVNETMRFNPGEINGGDGRQRVYPKYDKAECEAMRGLLNAAQRLIQVTTHSAKLRRDKVKR